MTVGPVTSLPRAVSPVTRMKIVVTGGPGAGKTTFIRVAADLSPKDAARQNTLAGCGVAAPVGSPPTVGWDFARHTQPGGRVLYLFGVPGPRLWFAWHEVIAGAAGVVVLADTTRLTACFAHIDTVEAAGLPFVVAVNRFGGLAGRRTREVRHALAVSVPVLTCDARERNSVLAVLTELTHEVTLARSG